MNFTWFLGVVEDRNDPIELGRVRVRCFGYHTSDTTDSGIPTKELPWAIVGSPTTSASISGVGHSPSGLVEGSWVIGIFLDGERAQEPLVISSIPSYSVLKESNPGAGFKDPNNIFPKYEGSDINELARGIDTKRPIVETKTSGFTSNSVGIYTKNHVYESESGHFREYDDTEGNERIREQHRSDTYKEILKDGTEEKYIVGNKYTVVNNDSENQTKGNSKIWIDKDSTIIISGAANTTISGDANIIVSGDANIIVSGTTTLTCPETEIDGDVTITGELRVDKDVSVGKDVETDGGISLNKHKHLILSGSSAGLTDKPL